MKNKKGFGFGELAKILLAILILLALTVMFLVLKDKISLSLAQLSGTGEKATESAAGTIDQILGNTILIPLTRIWRRQN